MEVDLMHGVDVPYLGNKTACHSLAMLSAFFEGKNAPDIDLFEALTTVPFGLVSVKGDPNRILKPWYDPDLGLDRACSALNLACEVCWWSDDTAYEEALACLRKWVSEGLVVIGPLNMDGLTYLFDRQIYSGCDHYLVVWGLDHNGWWVSDSERSVSEVISNATLADVWRANRIPEGRGAYILRRLKARAIPKLTASGLRNVFAWSQQNLRAAEKAARSGSAAYEALNADLQSDWTPSVRRALTYALPTRIQRICSQYRLLKELVVYGVLQTTSAANIVPLFSEEIARLSIASQEVLAGNIPKLSELGDIHREISARWCALEVTHESRI